MFNTEEEYIKSKKALSSIYIANTLPEITWIGGFTDEAKSETLGYSSYNSENGEYYRLRFEMIIGSFHLIVILK